MNAELPQAHPAPSPRQLLWPREQSRARALLHTPGLTLTLNARGALFLVFSHLRDVTRTRVLVPAYHCPSVVAPLLAAGLQPVFYRIDRNLQVDWADLLDKAGPRTRAVLVIHFFGHETGLAPLDALRRSGVAVVEDWSHSFLRADNLQFPGAPHNHRVYSLWKLLPTQVGGAWLRPVGVDGAAHAQVPAGVPLRQQAVLAKRLLDESLTRHGPALLACGVQRIERWRASLRRPPNVDATSVPPGPLQRAGETYYPFAPERDALRMPWWVRRMVAGSDLAQIAARRLRHHAQFAQALQGHALVRPVHMSAPQAVPWVFPVLVEGRDQFDCGWRARGVPLHTFGIYLHSALFRDTGARVIEDALFLADRLLCLAVHQDLDDAEVERACQVLVRAH